VKFIWGAQGAKLLNGATASQAPLRTTPAYVMVLGLQTLEVKRFCRRYSVNMYSMWSYFDLQVSNAEDCVLEVKVAFLSLLNLWIMLLENFCCSYILIN